MNAYIEKLTITENGRVVADLSFDERLTTLPYRDTIVDCLLCVLGDPDTRVLCKAYALDAIVRIQDTYRVRGYKPKGHATWDVTVTCGDTVCTKDYFAMLKNNPEADDLTCFHRFKKHKYPHRLEQYKHDLIYYPTGELARRTNGYGATRSFRGFIAQYIRHFKPIQLNGGSYLHLLPNGRFVVRNRDGEEIPHLSESENLLYRYYSFLSLADFWARAERVRNLHCIDRPLIVSHLLEFLDESIDASEIVRHASRIGRQVILFTPILKHG